HRSAKLDFIGVEDGQVRYDLSYADGRQETVLVEKALISVGRTPNVMDLGLEHTGIDRDPVNGNILVNGTSTSLPNIHVVGDATASNMLVNLGEMEGRHVVERIWSG
ncbi:MAG TPA: pyridine nucleotide-disulfide oxidoreductase, partial [Flavobacteriales bacterium]|nr:pyridine nucleotide-disulfide oxidoreductase [Flavobacteriales bacterium]